MYVPNKFINEAEEFIKSERNLEVRRFILNFSKLAQPLTEFAWTRERPTSFKLLRDIICNSPILKYLDFTSPFTVRCDSSGTAIGAVLSQKVNGAEHPVYYISPQLNKAEHNYSTMERECLAVVFACKKWRYSQYGHKLTVVTDHRPLHRLLSLKEPSSRLARWALLLSEHDFEVERKAGKDNVNADALSRIPVYAISPPYTPIWDRQ
ncbi:hypothetical protein PR048_013237 [Dryococelus australis]|uniref:Reverse transcriptase RNase H-like domain-containing protein n=1 Tax=Dryococelus australis TaxID=614101 RepID=A0ABQ9HRK3_9NEOP|nr:hypothetical protein PR048_013237 [Dryococelus australis]